MLRMSISGRGGLGGGIRCVKAEADMTWDGQASRGQARRARVLYCSDWTRPFVVMVDGAAGGTYQEQSWAGWSTVLSFP